ncbi:hypothetical protein Trihar35433_2323 [Trichoderma harzianum]|nr:hypothetical protein Trihar35433_2323 [Trichoderma harzianum]
MANLTANFMFKRDLEDAFLYHIKFLLSADVQDVEIQNVVKFFISPPRRLEEKLSKYGCWCDKARISRHHYSSCENIEGTPYPSIIGKDPTDHGKHNVPLCPDIDDTVPTDLKDHNHRLGCFKPLKSAEIFMKWFMQQGVWDDSPYLKYMDEIAQVKDFVDEYARRASVYGTPEFDRDGNVETVCRLLAGFWREDIVGDARKSHVAWEAERLLKFLRWNEFKLEECLKELRLAMKKVDDLEENGKDRGAVLQENNTKGKNRHGGGTEGNIRRGGAFLQKNHIREKDRRGGAILQKKNLEVEKTGTVIQKNNLEEDMGGTFQENHLEEDMRVGGPVFQGNDMKDDNYMENY